VKDSQNSDEEKEPKTKELRRGALYASLLLLFLFSLEFGIYVILNSGIQTEREERQKVELNAMRREARIALNSVILDLSYLTKSSLTKEYLVEPNSDTYEHLSALLSNIMLFEENFDQVRVIDSSGYEVVRTDHSNGNTTVTPDSLLQYKGDRYYFLESINLNSHDMYVSDFDLNIENGSVDYPLKPMIRYAQTVTDSTGTTIGIGIVNYLGENLLNALTALNQHSGDKLYILNEDGYYLKADDPSHERGFMIPERSEQRFSSEFPLVWSQMGFSDSGIVCNKDGEYYYLHVPFIPDSLPNHDDKCIILVMHVPHQIIQSELYPLLIGLSVGFLFLAPLLSFLGWKLGRYQIHHTWFLKQLELEATHDPLTGLYNRRAIMDILTRHMHLSVRSGTLLSVGFVDVNDLKKINDEIGHDAGDMLLVGTSDVMKRIIRDSDAVARLGGDEFLIVFPDCPQKEARQIMGRIQSCLAFLGNAQMDRDWSMSWGVSQLSGKDDSLEDLIRRADERMYEQKMMMKLEKGRNPR